MTEHVLPLLTEMVKTFNQLNNRLNKLEDLIMSTQEEAAQALTDLNGHLVALKDQLAKASGEIMAATAAQTKAIEDLQAHVAQSGDVSPALQQALDNVQATTNELATATQALDDLNPDAPIAQPAATDSAPAA